MARLVKPGETPNLKRPAAITPEQRNTQLIAMSYDAAEDMIRSGKATSQVIIHFLKQGTARDELEKTKLELEGQLLRARTDQVAASEDVRELMTEVISAMKEYKGESQHD